MSAAIIDGKNISMLLKEELKNRVGVLKESHVVPGLAVILIGDNPASKVYVKNKQKTCDELGIYSEEYILPESTVQEELIGLIEKLNAKKTIDGILVQLPLPAHLNEKEVLCAISPKKDVDAFHPVNVGHLMIGDYQFVPCTPYGVLKLIQSTNIPIVGKNCVIIGRSNIVGKPMAMLMLHQNATVTICHSKTQDLPSVTKNADILISAVGKAGFVTKEMVKPGAIVIDVGMNRNEEGKLCGDCDYSSVSEVAGYITPVPGGVGPMTITMLMQNTILSAENRVK